MKQEDQKYKLWARELAGEQREGDQQLLQKQLQQDKESRHFNLIKEYWNQFFPSKTMENKQRILSSVMLQVLGDKPIKRPRMEVWYSAVSLLILALGISIFWGLYQSGLGTEMIHYQAGFGEVKNIVLPDGSEVSLNAATSLVVPAQFKGHTREVFLMGEGYFNVAKDPEHPFVISTTHMDVTVLGTQFNLKAYANDKEITTFLDEGKIQLTGHFSNREEATLEPGQEATLVKSTGQLKVVNRSGYKSGIWKEGKLIFYNNSLAEIAPILERRFGTKIIIMNDEVEAYKFSGDFSDAHLFELLGYLSAARPFHYEMKDDFIIITK